MAKRSRPAQGPNSLKPKKMPTNVRFSDYGQGATPHAKPVGGHDGLTLPGVTTVPKVTRGGPRGGKRAPRDPGVRITPLS